MTSHHGSYLLATAVAMCIATSAAASPFGPLGEPPGEDGTRTAMREGAPELAPMPFVMFCMDYPDDCRSSTSGDTVELTSEKLEELRAVNRRVNASIRPTPDNSLRRMWRLGVTRGDCNAYAVQKRHELIAAGWPANALLLAVAKTSWGQGHLLVVVRTDRGEYILDSLTSQVRLWQKANYKWVMRQSSADPMIWVSLNDSNKPQLPRPEWVAEADDTAPVAVAGRGPDRDTRSWAPVRGIATYVYDIGL